VVTSREERKVVKEGWGPWEYRAESMDWTERWAGTCFSTGFQCQCRWCSSSLTDSNLLQGLFTHLIRWCRNTRCRCSLTGINLVDYSSVEWVVVSCQGCWLEVVFVSGMRSSLGGMEVRTVMLEDYPCLFLLGLGIMSGVKIVLWICRDFSLFLELKGTVDRDENVEW